MKKLCCFLLSFCMLAAAFSGCAKAPANAPDETAGTGETLSPQAEEAAWLRENLPVMDGSTSLIPLEAGIRSLLLGVPFEEASAMVNHSTTWGAFYALLDGTADLIFTCPLSAAQRQEMAERDVRFEEVPVAMEAFVFVVNAENPVDALTVQQIKDIYAGKITNWRDVGGLDAPIIAYQRNRDSGSQNYMIDFMGETALMDPPAEWVPDSMGTLMDAIAVNDNAANAIGYSVYAYAADMYADSDKVKFIKVEGVAPGRSTIADGTYPLLDYNYAMFRADAPEDSAARRLTNFILTPEGQRAVADAGYVAVKEIGYDYSSKKGALYTGVGKGGPAPEAPGPWETVLRDGGGIALDGKGEIDFLADEALQAEVNAFLAQAKTEVEAGLEALARATGSRGKTQGLVTAKNGYLSAAVSVQYMAGHYPAVWDARNATWNLRTGKRLAPEELFFDGVSIGDALSDYLRVYVEERNRSAVGMEEEYHLLCEIMGLPETGWFITPDAVYFDHANPYFAGGAMVPLESFPRGLLVTETPYDMTPHFKPDAVALGFDGEVMLTKRFVPWWGNFTYAFLDAQVESPRISIGLLKEDAYPTAKKINAEITAYAEKYFNADALKDCENEAGWVEFFGFDCMELLGQYVLFRPDGPWQYTDGEESPARYPYMEARIYDLSTGERVDWTALLKDGWQAHATVETGVYGQTLPVSEILGKPLANGPASTPNGLYINVYTDESYNMATVTVPFEWVKF